MKLRWTTSIVNAQPRFLAPRPIQLLACSPTVVVVPWVPAGMTFDLSLGNMFLVAATSGAAFTINAPINSPGEWTDLFFVLRNVSGGALGAMTLNAEFKVRAALTTPANGFTRMYHFFRFNPSWLQEDSNNDVANA